MQLPITHDHNYVANQWFQNLMRILFLIIEKVKLDITNSFVKYFLPKIVYAYYPTNSVLITFKSKVNYSISINIKVECVEFNINNIFKVHVHAR